MENPKTSWNFVNSNRANDPIPSHMHFEDEDANSDQAIADSFAKYFESVYTASSIVGTPDGRNCMPGNVHIADLRVDIVEVFDAIGCLDNHKSPGIDGIPVAYIKQSRYIISRALWLIFNKS